VNLHAIASGAIASVNPMSQATLLTSTGSTENADGSRTPTFAPPATITVQIQSLQYQDIMKLEGLNIQGIRQKIYMNGDFEGLMRADQRGGDLIILPDGKTYIAAIVLENWPDWCCVAVTQQLDT
jgi:hypothetical protein